MVGLRKKVRSVWMLSWSLAVAHFKLKNEGSYVGVLWYLLDPFFLFLMLLLLRGHIAGGDDVGYPVYLLIGLVVFNFFRQATVAGVVSLQQNARFVRSMNVPSEAFVVNVVLQSVFSHVFEIVLLCFFMVYYGFSVVYVGLYVFVFLFVVLFVLGVSFVLATCGAFFNDSVNIWQVFSRLLWFATPIFYVVLSGSVLHRVNVFNPLYYMIEVSRGILMEGVIYWDMFGIVVCFAVVSFVLGVYVFERYKCRFAEVL